MIRPTLSQIEAFYWVAKFGSFQKAAEHIHVTPPAVSLRIKELERALDVTLLQRDKNLVRVTEPGALLLDNAAAILREMDAIEASFGSRAPLTERVVLGVSETFAIACLPDLFSNMDREHTRPKIELLVSNSPDLVDGVLSGRLDLAFVINPDHNPTLRFTPLGVQPVCWMGAQKYGLPETVTPGDLVDIPIITTPPPTPMYRLIMDWFHSADLEPTSLSICSSNHTIAYFIKEGMGVSYLPLRLFEGIPQNPPVVRFDSEPKVRDPVLYAVSCRSCSPAVSGLIESVRSILASINYLTPF